MLSLMRQNAWSAIKKNNYTDATSANQRFIVVVTIRQRFGSIMSQNVFFDLLVGLELSFQVVQVTSSRVKKLCRQFAYGWMQLTDRWFRSAIVESSGLFAVSIITNKTGNSCERKKLFPPSLHRPQSMLNHPIFRSEHNSWLKNSFCPGWERGPCLNDICVLFVISWCIRGFSPCVNPQTIGNVHNAQNPCGLRTFVLMKEWWKF